MRVCMSTCLKHGHSTRFSYSCFRVGDHIALSYLINVYFFLGDEDLFFTLCVPVSTEKQEFFSRKMSVKERGPVRYDFSFHLVE